MGFFSKLFGGAASSNAGGDYYANLLRLAPGETIAFSVGGFYIVGHGQFEGRQVTKGEQYLLAFTTAGRFVLGDMQTMKPERARAFEAGSLRIQDHGFIDRDGGIISGRQAFQQAGPTGVMERLKVVTCTPAGGAPFSIGVVESQVAELIQRAGG